jgi:predicted nucleic-acid-binding protein
MDGFRRQIAERDDTISQLRTQILLKDNRASDAATTAEILVNYVHVLVVCSSKSRKLIACIGL